MAFNSKKIGIYLTFFELNYKINLGENKMERKAMRKLLEWKRKKDKKPLLIYGARQVGKTYLVKEFGQKEYRNIIYVNFETNKIISDLIKENIDTSYIIKELEILFNEKIDETTLIFFDEIQESPRINIIKIFL